MFSAFLCFPEACRCHAELFLKMDVKVLDGIETGQVGGLADAAICGQQQLSRFFQSDGADELQWRKPRNGLQLAVQLCLAHSHVAAQGAYRIFRVVNVPFHRLQGFFQHFLVQSRCGDGIKRYLYRTAEQLLPFLLPLDELAYANEQ